MSDKQRDKLNQLNQFTQGENRVWFDAKTGNVDFAYSDGQEIEQRLREILTQAEDLSHLSYELKAHITDWPTEYHLSPVRSNLIRALNLKGVKRVLELGCGCGSITRYLGDFQHADGSTITVDSVEGSAVRAELAALRCRDLPNVNVATANFNDIDFPEDYYDLVLFVGVTEYAGRFSDRESDEEALQDLLSLAKRATTQDGVVMVAIENRTGFKYVEGANEDHYAKPFIGIHNYAQPAGIRTYTKKEWQSQIELAGFQQREFIYPFPDYKVPTIFLGEQYVDDNPYSFNHLEGCRSRDYIKDFHYASKEVLFWESTTASKTLGDYANSFMMLMSNSQDAIAQMSDYDFLHLPGYQRKLEFCMSIAKPKGEDKIQRNYIVDDAKARAQMKSELVHQRIESETFVQGPMLSVEWSRSLISYPDLSIFENYLREYFSFLQQCEKANTLNIDLLPNNIILSEPSDSVDSVATYHIVDEEWQVQQTLTSEFVYYRAILLFYMTYPDFVEEKAIPEKLRLNFTLEDWVRYGFTVVGKNLNVDQFYEFATANEGFQNAISTQSVEIDYDTLLDKEINLMALRWNSNEAEEVENNLLQVAGSGYFKQEEVVFSLPNTVRSLENLQFFPCGDDVIQDLSFFRIYSVKVMAVKANQADKSDKAQRILWSLVDEQVIAEQADLKDMKFSDGELGKGFYSHQYFPSLMWQLPELDSLTVDEQLIVSIETRFPVTGYTQNLLKSSSELSSELLPIKTKLAQIEGSQSYALALKISALVGRLRDLKSSVSSLLKKKGLNSSSGEASPKWCLQETNEIDSNPAPLVSIIIPFRDEPQLLDSCIRSLVEKTHYANYEIIAVSNDSVQAKTHQLREAMTSEFPQCRFIDHNVKFNFSALVNRGVAEANGEFVVLLNNDVEIQTNDWLDEMLAKVKLENVGIVGGYLSFPDGRVQHLGLHIGDSKLPEHTFKTRRNYEIGLKPYLKKPRFVTAVTGAMMMCSKQLWTKLEGFDEKNFGVAFNDVDFCLRAKAEGYESLVQPKAKAIHLESVSRGYETTVNKMRRFKQEQQRFIDIHHETIEQGDQYYSA